LGIAKQRLGSSVATSEAFNLTWHKYGICPVLHYDVKTPSAGSAASSTKQWTNCRHVTVIATLQGNRYPVLFEFNDIPNHAMVTP